jgi:aminomethyltransferase
MTTKKTPLYATYKALGAKLRDAGGYYTPAAFSDVAEEHQATREAAGLFEIFGQFLVEVAGQDAVRFLNENLVADFEALADGKVVYTTILNAAGGIIDDLTVFRVNASKFWVVPAPHRVDLVESLLADRAPDYGVHVVSLGYKYVSLSLQGPKSRDILMMLTDLDLSSKALPSFSFAIGEVAGFGDTVISRTGFSGELGYELFVRTERVEDVYERLLEVGSAMGLKPCGVGALMTLRIEKRFPVYGRDLNDTITPVEAGLGWTVRRKAAVYPGKDVVERQKAEGVSKRMVLLKLPADADLPTAGASVSYDGREIGSVTSSAFGHTVGAPLAIAFVQAALAVEGTEVLLDDRVTASVHPKALHDPNSERSRA